MPTSAVKYTFVTRDAEGTPFAGRIEFWTEKPVLTNGVWNTPNGCDNSEDANLWILIAGLDFTPGTIIKNVQINTNWE